MSFWNYIGEFFLFRRLFGAHEHRDSKHNVSDESFRQYDNHDYGASQSLDSFIEEQEDYDMIDDDF